jgi:hypothetical protein
MDRSIIDYPAMALSIALTGLLKWIALNMGQAKPAAFADLDECRHENVLARAFRKHCVHGCAIAAV